MHMHMHLHLHTHMCVRSYIHGSKVKLLRPAERLGLGNEAALFRTKLKIKACVAGQRRPRC